MRARRAQAANVTSNVIPSGLISYRVVPHSLASVPLPPWYSTRMGSASRSEADHVALLVSAVYSSYFANRVRGRRIEQVLIAPSSPWQSPCVERLIGSIRRECLDHLLG